MASEKTVKKVGEIFELINGYAFKSKEFKLAGAPVFKIKNIKAGTIILDGLSYVDESYLESKGDKKVQKNDLLITMTGNRHDGSMETWVGKVAWFNLNQDFLINQRVGILRLKENSNYDSRFLGYQLSSEKMQKHFISIATSSGGQANLSPNQIKDVDIAIPHLSEQKKIVSIIGSMEDKIINNELIISNLEQLAQTLFKRWFVDFEFPNENGDPYKSSGGKMVESELGVMPQNWNLGTLNDLGKIVGGGTPSKKVASYYTDNGYSWITPKDLSNDQSVFIYKGAIDITEEALKKSGAKLYPEKTVLFSSRAPIGYVAIAGQKVATNQGFKSIIPNDDIPNEYIYSLLIHLTPVIEANAGGSTFKEISGTGMKGINTVIPSEHVLANYKSIVEPLFNKIKEIEQENRSLISLRDTLLPKLLSGEIELPDETEVTENVSIS